MKTACLILLAILVGIPTTSQANHDKTRIYSIHLGVKAAPAESKLPTLRYADDDALRFYRFVRGFAQKAHLFTVLDEESQKKNPNITSDCMPPTRAALRRTLLQMKDMLEADRQAGFKVVLYLTYSGHGIQQAGRTQLTLLDGFLDRDWLEEHFLSLPADTFHLMVDACHAEGLVRDRGAILKEVNAESQTISPKKRTLLLDDDWLKRHPQLGALLASAADQKTHEWSRLESGVFTHELLSALSGAADVNADGEIAYSEVAAFVAAANRSIPDPRATIEVVSLPPRINYNTPILARRWIRTPSTLTGIPSGLGHFYLETERGVRTLDAHPEPFLPLWLLVPAGQSIWVRTADEKLEASFSLKPGQSISFAAMQYQDSDQVTDRGSLEQSLRRGFFAEAYGAAYYRGYVDSRKEAGVSFKSSSQLYKKSTSDTRAWSITSWTGSGLAFISAAILGSLAIKNHQDYLGTDIERQAQSAKDRRDNFTIMAVGSGLLCGGLAVLGWWLWPDEPEQSSGFTLGPAPFEATVGTSLIWHW
jgi:hypothetical protein